MPSTVEKLYKSGLIKDVPLWLPDNTFYEVVTGSIAYGCNESVSDFDIVGFCIPKKELIFPYLSGEIYGFGRQHPRFEQWVQHHVYDKDALGGSGRTYDMTIFSIVRFFHLCMENNPNMVDVLFVPQDCVLHSTKIGQKVRENRRMFLHKGCWPKFKGYAYSQLHKMGSHNRQEGGKRAKDVEEFGFDRKFAYHVVRLMCEVEQILLFGDLDLRKDKEYYKAIRKGEVKEDDIRAFFTTKEKDLEKAYHESKLPWGPNEEKIKALLLECLEDHYGSLEKVIVNPDKYKVALEQVLGIAQKGLL